MLYVFRCVSVIISDHENYIRSFWNSIRFDIHFVWTFRSFRSDIHSDPIFVSFWYSFHSFWSDIRSDPIFVSFWYSFRSSIRSDPIFVLFPPLIIVVDEEDGNVEDFRKNLQHEFPILGWGGSDSGTTLVWPCAPRNIHHITPQIKGEDRAHRTGRRTRRTTPAMRTHGPTPTRHRWLYATQVAAQAAVTPESHTLSQTDRALNSTFTVIRDSVPGDDVTVQPQPQPQRWVGTKVNPQINLITQSSYEQ